MRGSGTGRGRARRPRGAVRPRPPVQEAAGGRLEAAPTTAGPERHVASAVRPRTAAPGSATGGSPQRPARGDEPPARPHEQRRPVTGTGGVPAGGAQAIAAAVRARRGRWYRRAEPDIARRRGAAGAPAVRRARAGSAAHAEPVAVATARPRGSHTLLRRSSRRVRSRSAFGRPRGPDRGVPASACRDSARERERRWSTGHPRPCRSESTARGDPFERFQRSTAPGALPGVIEIDSNRRSS